MSRQQRFLCGVPADSCIGGNLQTDQQLGTNKCHTSRREAMKCKARHLESQGFVKLSSRQFVNPENGRIRILPKQSKFGGRLRQGKGENGARFEPEERSGLIH